MINNYMCEKCEHVLVCKKINTLENFNSEHKKYIDIDITMESCKDFQIVESETDSEV